MSNQRAKPVVAWALVDPHGYIDPHTVSTTPHAAQRTRACQWREAVAFGWRVARVEIREIEEGQDDEQG